MSDVILVLLRSLISGCQSQRRLLLENLALRHQLAVVRRLTHKPKLGQLSDIFDNNFSCNADS